MYWFYNCDILSENYDVTMCLLKLSTKISRQQDLHKYKKSEWTNAAKILKVQSQYIFHKHIKFSDEARLCLSYHNIKAGVMLTVCLLQ